MVCLLEHVFRSAMFVAILSAFVVENLRAEDVADMLETVGIEAGLAIHVGTSDGKIESRLTRRGDFLVQGLALDETACARARRGIVEAGAEGPAGAVVWHDKARLPYADNLVNLLVVDADSLGSNTPTDDEIMRVLVPGDRGAACIKKGGKWKVVRKPMPAVYDGWEQYWYDATGNSMSRDAAVQPSTGLQWIAGCQEAADQTGYRFSEGKLVYKRPVPSRKDRRGTVRLICRDAFNGLPYWSVNAEDMPGGNTPLVGKLTPLIYTNGKVYTTFGTNDSPLVALDATSGELVRTYAHAGLTFDRYSPRAEALHRAGIAENFGKGNLTYYRGELLHTLGSELFVVDAASGRRRWHYQTDKYPLLQKPRVNPDDGELYVVACSKGARRGRGGGRNPGHRAAAVLAFDLASGRPKWTMPIDERHITHAVYGERTLVIFSAQDNGPRDDEWIFAAIDTTTGRIRWRHADQKGDAIWPGMQQRREPVICDGKLYLLAHGLSIYDLKTGEPEFHFHGGNSRCETSKATASCLVMAFSQFIDYRHDPIRGKRVALSRGACGSGFFPAYGMVHYLPNMCNCDFFIRFHVTASSEPVRDPLPDEQRLVRGDATVNTGPVKPWPKEDEWPIFLGGPQRSSWNQSRLPAQLRQRWSATVQSPPSPDTAITTDWLDTNDYNGPISAPVVASNTAYVSVREQRRVAAVDATTGDVRWSFKVGGRVATPPTVYDGMCLFGCRDGWVYALKADTGKLAWKFLAAPYERNIVAFSQVESAWPLLGSILIHDGLAVAVAGYHPMTGGGIHVYGLVPATGEIKWHTVVERTPQWVDLTEPRARIDQPHETSFNNGGFEANVVQNDLAYGYGPQVRFSFATLTASDGRLVAGEDLVKTGGGLGNLETRSPMPLLINSHKAALYRRHYFDAGGWSSCGYGTSVYLTLPAAAEKLMCERFAFSGPDLVVIQRSKLGYALRRYDARKLSDREAISSDQTPHWTKWLDGDLRSREKGQKTYRYSSLLVAGDTIVIGGRIDRIHGGYEPVPGPRQVAEGIVKTYDFRTGEPRQTIELDAAPVASGLAASCGRVFAACEDGSLRCLSE